jgi:hypothetical protein
MSHKFPLPSDTEIENLITRAYKDLPKPDSSRLSLIESNLLQQAKGKKSEKKLNKMPWWVVLLLTGGFATAAWWAGELFFDREEMVKEVKQSAINPEIIDKRSGTNQTESENDNREIVESPIIYQRENF